MTVSIPDDETTVLLEADTGRVTAKALWIQNFSETVGFYVQAKPQHNSTADAVTVGEEFYLPPASSATLPSTFLTDNPALVAAKWLARQDSGASVDLNAGRF